MPRIEFESAREKEKKRQWEREARAAVLEKAKNKYEAEHLREEARIQRGENQWILPSVESKLASSKKKKKKEKKKKKKKKSKKKKDHSSSSSSSESEDDEKWVVKPSTSVVSTAPVQSAIPKVEDAKTHLEENTKRDGWMEMTSLFKTYSRDEIKEKYGTSRKKEKEEERKRKEEEDKPGSHARELNPYFKNGGIGLPEPEKKLTSAPSSIGLDAAWLRRALQRAKEQAKLENVTLEEIAAQRWGSLEKFNSLLEEAEGNSSSKLNESHLRRGREMDYNRTQNRKWNRDEERETSSNRDSKYRSKDRRSRNRDRERSMSRDRMRSRSRERKNKRSRSRERRSRSRERKRSASRDRTRSKSTERKRSRSGERKKRSRSRDRKQRSRNEERKRRSRSKESQRPSKRYSDSGSSTDRSSSTQSSDSESGSSSKDRRSHSQADRKDNMYEKSSQPDTSRRALSGLRKPADENARMERSSLLASKFHKPGEQPIKSRYSCYGSSTASSSVNRGWQKKDKVQEIDHERQEKSTEQSVSSSSSSSSESSDEEPIPEKMETSEVEAPSMTPSSEKQVVLTDKEMNELAAKIMKAELIGNDTLAFKLKNKLESARITRANTPLVTDTTGDSSGIKEEVVILTRTDPKGFSRPVNVSHSEKGKKKLTKMKTHGKDGQRQRYFPDDDEHDLKKMFEAEKTTTADDQNSMFNRAAMNNSEKLNENYDLDDMFMSKAVMKENSAKQAERDKKRAIQEHQRSERSLESCQWCFENKEMAKHLIVALGTKAYVCLPPHESLTCGHCLIIPIHHTMCSVQADEDLWGEIMQFRKSLVKMFSARDEDCVFFETTKRLRNYPHMVIHCVPLPREIGDMAPVYFKKAIMECEAEWAHNKKLVDLKNRDVRRAVPKGLPYFFVDFAMDPGFAHIIEDEQDFPHNFAQEIIGGMLDLDNNLWRKPRKENFDAQRRKVMEFSRWYKEYDITQEND